MKSSLSSYAILVSVIVCFIINFSFDRFQKTKDVIKYDIVTYYEYLPLIFIYDDIRVEKHYGTEETKACVIWTVPTPEGKSVIKMTMGLSILYSPFFFLAHLIAQPFGYPADGYSQPYTTLLLLSTIFYLLLGMYYMKKILQHYLFSDSTIAITILFLGIGTNILCYASQSAPMPHVYLFCMIAIFFYYTTQWNHTPTIKNSLLIGLTSGLISLIRPSDIIIVLLFALYGVTGLKDLRSRAAFLRKNFFMIVLIIFSAFLVWLPQLIYWKIATGHFIYYSYNNERFYFTQPRIIEGLFSFRKGWLLYTPMMLFAFAGLFLLKDELKKIQTGIWLFILLNIYITFSWWCWWYGGAFGMRSMIDSYAIMALPLASTVNYFRNKKRLVRILFFSSAIFFVVLNIFQTYQYEKRILRYDGINRKLYFKIFGKTTYKPEYDELATQIDAREAVLGRNSIYEPSPVYPSFLSEDSVYIQSQSGRYLTLSSDENKIELLAENSRPGEKEIFVFKKLQNDLCAISAQNHMYISANLYKNGEVRAEEESMLIWETFSLIKVDTNSFALKASNGKYISVSENSFRLIAKSDTIGDSEKFHLLKTK